jgi:uncharacterized integral membrane protein
MPVLRAAAAWNTARKRSVNSCLVNHNAAKFINKNPVIVSVLSTRIRPNITSVVFIILTNTILSQRFCVTVSNRLMVHRIASMHNSIACSVNLIIDQPNLIPISMLFLCPVLVCLFAACVNIIRSRIVCAKVYSLQVVHRISSVHNSLACSVNFFTNQFDACFIWMLLLSSFSVCLFAVCVKRAIIKRIVCAKV